MENLLGRRVRSLEAPVYGVFRLCVGLLFAQHGLQKLFGLLGGNGPVPLASQFGVAGVIELVGGLLIAVGLLTRLVAVVAAVEMVAAQVIAHLPRGVVPIQNGGELSLLFLLAFLVIVVFGGGRYSLERLLLGRELF
jgi:putative oxidoreductase